ncbi:MAG: alpha/beta hydrolase, partial [Mucinivorans sp.]
DIRLNDYISDAKGWADKMVRDGRFQKVVFIGHSEGSLIAMSAAASGAKVGGVVSIAGPGRTFDQVLKDQLGEQPPQIRDIAYSIIDSLQQGLKVSRVPFFLVSLFRPSVQNYLISMMRHNPQFEIRKVGVPVLIVQGDADIQVRMEDARLLAAANPHARLRVIAGMNHVLKNCPSIDKQMQMATYINPTIPIDIHLVNEIVKFIKNL